MQDLPAGWESVELTVSKAMVYAKYLTPSQLATSPTALVQPERDHPHV